MTDTDAPTVRQLTGLDQSDLDILHASPYKIDWYKIPNSNMIEGCVRYLIHGVRPGHFLCALFENDLVHAFGSADSTNQRVMDRWASWLYNECPMQARGSEAKVNSWIKMGGIKGQMELARAQMYAEDGEQTNG